MPATSRRGVQVRDPDLGFSVHAELTTPRHTWRAWRCVLTPSDSAAIALWLLDCPFAHPVWHQWLLSLVHLREVEGLPPPVGRGHELVIFAVDPQIGLEPDVQLNTRALMMPPIVLRFASYDGDDIGAEAHVESLVEATMRRELSPDDDCRRLWQARIGRRS